MATINPTIGFQPTQGPGSFNYQPINSGYTDPVGSGGLPGSGAQYLNSLANYGGPAVDANQGILGPELFQNISQGVGAFTSLAQIYGMFQSLGLQKKAFKFAQEGTKRNFNAQATAYNETIASKETARRAYATANGQDYNSLYAYGTGQRVNKWP